MVVKFEIGQRYYSVEPYIINNEIKVKKHHWLCIKRNDKTGYVGFYEILGRTLNGPTLSRKAMVTKLYIKPRGTFEYNSVYGKMAEYIRADMFNGQYRTNICALCKE